MPDIAIRVENISKKYRIEASGGPAYHRLSEAASGLPEMLWNAGRSLLKRSSLQTNGSHKSNEFCALKDVSFEIRQGEVVGIIGRNGAGKSTLLKILSRITEPTSGRFGIRGRVVSLLEVGTGFHTELTGRENIYVSGITLGMTRAEIKKRFDEIVDFSGVEKFLDTPVKHYSSGMQVRLGFAVAAHLVSEILIIDEVLAVGDGDFQKKCLSKMRSLRTEGRTVLIVSHQMAVVNSLCSRGIVLAQGQVRFTGSATEAVHFYQSSASSGSTHVFEPHVHGPRIGDEFAELHRAWIANASGTPAGTFDLSEAITIGLEYSLHRDVEKVAFPNFHVFDERGEYVFCVSANLMQLASFRNAQGRYQVTCIVPSHLLNVGTFVVGIAVTCMNPGASISFFERDALRFQVTEDFDATLCEKRHGYAGPIPGPIRPELEWSIQLLDSSHAS